MCLLGGPASGWPWEWMAAESRTHPSIHPGTLTKARTSRRCEACLGALPWFLALLLLAARPPTAPLWLFGGGQPAMVGER
jgi:hypothetical protein